jgi:hypothetical protein
LAACVAGPLLLGLRGQWAYAASLHTPWPEDDVPVAVQWIERHARPGAVLFTRKLGPEVEYAAWRTSVKSQQLVEKTDRFGAIAVERLEHELFLFFSPTDERDWLAAAQASLPEGFALTPLDVPGLRVCRLYRLSAPAAVGVVGEEIVYWREGAVVRAPLSCATIGRLLHEALAGQPEAAGGVGFVWQVCDPTPAPETLAWQAGGFPAGPLNVARAAFYYEQPQLDWQALAASRRLAIRSTRAARAEFLIRGEDLAAYIQKKNKNLGNLRVAVVGDELRVYADARLLGRSFAVVVAGRIGLAGRKLLFRPDDAAINGVAPPKFLLSYAAKVMNPVFEVDLTSWALAPVDIAVTPAPDSAIVLTAGGIAHQAPE